MANPYRRVHARVRENQGRRLPTGLLPLLAAALATPFARPVLLGFLDGDAISAGTEAVAFRLGALIVAALSLHTYTELVRGSDRPVLDPHPVQPRPLVAALAWKVALERWYLPAMAAVLLAPVGLAGHWAAWGGAVALAAGAYVCGLGLGVLVSLGGVWAAFSPGLASVLDFLRGDNPRMQAALIYAPGVVLAVGGLAVGLAAGGLGAAIDGWTPGLAMLALPPVVGGLALLAAGPVADATYVKATALLAEIEAMWGGVEDAAEEDRRVYLEWVAGPRTELLRALRQGWRRLRTWPTGAWILGFGGFFAGWSGEPGAPGRVVAFAGGAVLLVAAVAPRLAEGDPEWLDRALGVSAGQVGRARATVAWLYAQGAIIPPVLAVAVRHGAGEAAGALAAVEALAAVGAVVSAGVAWRWRGKGLLAYGPVAVVLWALVAGAMV